MRVSNPNETVTHAILGGQEARQFGISDDPAFFQILSSTLYTDQPLAVVRETLCNAWDAHIEAGKTDVPIQISIDGDSNLVIRDFGPGIADEDMGPIYGIYGASTKKKNKNVTGGFGLGCKSPFSYTDHFEVTSWHSGKQTIYNLARSSGEVEGRPGIFPIASFPTTETGLQVSIPLRKEDHHKFRALIKTIVENGEILAELDGHKLRTLPFSKAAHGVLLDLRDSNNIVGGVFVRYGNVVYPLPRSEELRDARRAGDRLLKEAGIDPRFAEQNGRRVIFQAPPNSLSVTPSREALSATPQTVKTLSTIIPAAVESILEEKDYYDFRAEGHWRLGIRKASTEDLLSGRDRRNRYMPSGVSVVTDTENLSITSLMRELRQLDGHALYNEELSAITRELARRPGLNTSFLRSIRAAALQKKILLESSLAYLTHRDLIHPLVKKLTEAGVSTKGLTLGAGGNQVRYEKVRRVYPETALSLARKILVLGFSHEDFSTRGYGFAKNHGIPHRKNHLHLRVTRSSKKIGQIRKIAAELGFDLWDMTVAQKWENANVVTPNKPAEAKKKPQGLPSLAAALDYTWRGDALNTAGNRLEKHLIETPEFVTTLKKHSEGTCYCVDIFDHEGTDAIRKLFGDRVGVAVSTTQMDAYIKKGAINLQDKLLEMVLKEYQSNRRIRAHLARDWTRLDYVASETLCEILEKTPELQKSAGFSTTLTEEDWQIITIGRSLRKASFPRYSYSAPIIRHIYRRFKRLFENIPLREDFAKKIPKLGEKYQPALQYAYLPRLLRNPETREGALNILRTIIKD